MTEAEWLACGNRDSMLRELRARATPRKLRLYACACYRTVWDRLDQPASRAAVEVAERFADGLASATELRAARTDTGGPLNARFWVTRSDAFAAAWSAIQSQVPDNSYSIAIGLIHDTFGNPFRPVVFFPEWRTDTVRALAAQMYETREFSALPILADALQDAGCDNDDVLGHCRSDANQPHARGCWVVDLVLGKE